MLSSTGQVGLRDGRRLSYAAAGAPDGFPVLYFHGAIGSPLRRSAQLEAAIERFGVRYVMVDRPGYRGSDALPDRAVAHFAPDVEDLADALGFERFSVVGVSAGGPYALACAWALPARTLAAAVVSSIPPGLAAGTARGMRLRFRLPLMAMAMAPHLSARLADGAIDLVRRRPGLVRRLMCAGADPVDRGVLAEREAADTAARSFLTATARGTQPMIADYLACCGEWGFDPAAATGRVQLWHGVEDRLVPVAYARRLAAALPNCAPAFVAGDAHFFFRRRLDEILAPLVPGAAAAEDLELAA